MQDANTTSPQPPLFDEVVLCIAIALFIALGIAYVAYPAYYYQHHPRPMIPIHPEASTVWVYPTLVYFFLAGLTALSGFLQTRFIRWNGRESSRLLFWVFLLSTLVIIAGSWRYALAIRFWTLATNQELFAAIPELQKVAPFLKWSFRLSFAAALLNVGYAILHKPQDKGYPGTAQGSREG
jgi:hypothetical protein